MTFGINERFDFDQALPDLDLVRAAHFIAIGGSGMSGVARLFLARGVRVTGSDNVELPILDELRAEGATVSLGYDAAPVQALPDDAVVVVSSAIKEDNPQLSTARARGLRVLHRSQGLGMLMAGQAGLAVAGANGKTTTSAMAVVALRAMGADPSFAIGAPIAGIGANSGVGSGEEFVVEADESDGSFVVYHPRVAIVTNVKDDHLDFYGDSAGVRAAYHRFVDTIAPSGLLVTCADDDGAIELAGHARAQGIRVLTYGVSADADLRLVDLRGERFDWRAALVDTSNERYELRLSVPGTHNLLDAAGVVLALHAGFGMPIGALVRAVGTFHGTSRRFEIRGQAAGVRVVDDYAHNPGKLDAVVRTGLVLREGGRLIVLFQPHLYSRTHDSAAGLADALSLTDVAIVMDIYGAREAPVEGVTSALIVDRIHDAEAIAVHSAREAVDAVISRARPGDLVLTVGAGDVTALGPQILTRLNSNV